MISYAQNFEDVILARAFAGQKCGFYIDVGVWHPTNDSVTKHFYDLGWSGVNVEALPEQHQLIAQARPRDTNLHAAASSKPGSLRMHRVKDSGLSTASTDFAQRHAADGWQVETLDVPTITLADICRQHAAGKVIDFMKIDVEGAEADVIASGDWHTFRPRVLLVEATEPNAPTPAYADWEPTVLAADYAFCYFDGLNRWYVPADDATLRSAFHAPPNPFDNYVPAAVAELQAQVQQLRARLHEAQTRPGSADLASALRKAGRRLGLFGSSRAKAHPQPGSGGT